MSRNCARSLFSVLLVGLCSTVVHARPNGIAVECGGCHYGQLAGGGMAPVPTVTAMASATRVEPGERIDITVTVESNWDAAVAAGFLVKTDEGGGAFASSEQGVGNVGITDGEPFEYAVGHTRARQLVGGVATFEATWTAPTTVGAHQFAVYGVTSDDGDGEDDAEIAEESNEPFGKFEFAVGVGCDLVTYYYDGDGDGYGRHEMLSCDPPEGYVTVGGDCKDDNPEINPGATELCSFTDENCDGEAMAPPTFYRDVDGDGFGDAADLLVDGCTLPDGYATQAGDCALDDPNVYPTAIEVPGNGVDDNCNGQVDEVDPGATEAPSSPTLVPSSQQPTVTPTASETIPSAAPSTSAPLGPTPAHSGGSSCSVSSRHSGGRGGGALLLLCAVLVSRRRRRDVRFARGRNWA